MKLQTMTDHVYWNASDNDEDYDDDGDEFLQCQSMVIKVMMVLLLTVHGCLSTTFNLG